jgi:hypothetical protein
MKPMLLVTVLMAFLAGSTQALAGGGHGHGGYSGCGHGCGGGYYPRGGYYYPRGGYYYGPYYGHHNNNNNSNSSVAYALGGLVLGGLLTNAYNQSRAPRTVYVQQAQPAQVVAAPQQGRRLVRDLSGNCYERTTDSAGNELRTELPASACNW